MNQQNVSINEYYSTSDMALACVISLFYPVDSVDRQDPHRALFLFKRDSSLDKLIEAYWRRELQVEPQAYFQQLKIIKARLHAENI